MKNFKDKVAVITGAASGIGMGIAEHCAGNGIKMVLADIEAKPLSDLQARLENGGAQVIAVVTDVSKFSDVDLLARKSVERFGRVDLLFSNAGVAAGNALWESSLEDCQWVIDVNLWGVIHCLRAFIPVMIKQDTPCHIVNTSSITGVATYHPSCLYHLTKHGILAVSEQVYHDLKFRGLKINISVVCPGFVNTNLMDAQRNRQERYCNADAAVRRPPGADEMEKAFRRMIENGMAPGQVAEMVFDAIEQERFYIFTHPELLGLAGSRMNHMMQGKNPVLPPMEKLL